MKAVSGRMTVRKISRDRLSGFSTLLVTKVVAYLKIKSSEIILCFTLGYIFHIKINSVCNSVKTVILTSMVLLKNDEKFVILQIFGRK